MRLGLVGAGAIAQSYVQAVRGLDDLELVGVADLRSDAAAATAEDAGCPAYGSHTELLAGQVDAAVVCTPPSTHPEIVLDFLEGEIPVLCEKPLCIGVGDAQRMVETSRRTGTLLTMASKFRYTEDMVRAKSLLSSGVLGDIILFENSFTSRVEMRRRWNSEPAVSGGGVLIDNGTHSVDLFRYLLGPVAEVQAVEGRRVQGLDVEDTVQIFARSTDGAMATIDLSWSLNKELDSYVHVYGSAGTVRVGWQKSCYKQTSGRDWVVFGDGYDKVAAFRAQLANFRAAIAGRQPLRITLEDGLASVEVIDAAYRSLATNNWVKVENGRT